MEIGNLYRIVRNLLRKPGFTLVTVATLALGIGASAVILSVVNGVLLQPLPFPDADRLVRVYHTAPGLNLGFDDIGLSEATYFFFRDSGVLEDLAIYQEGGANLSGGEEPRRVGSVSVSHSFFDTLGVAPLHGRPFNPDDEAPGAPGVIILAESLWRGAFGARPEVVGETVLMDGETVEIVGVVPAAVTFPSRDAGIYEPMSLDPQDAELGSLGTASVGRLPPGVTPAEAGAALDARIADLTEAFPDSDAAPILQRAGLTANAIDLRERMVGDIEPTLWMLAGSVGFILLIACANVANVFLVRAEGREREMAIRSAMGADIARMVVGRNLIVTAIGIGIGVGGAAALTLWMQSLLFGVDPLDPLTFAAVIVTLAAVSTLAAWLPARRAARVDPLEALRHE